MKNRIFMYLFIFTLLIVIFQFVNSKKIIENYDEKLSASLDREQVYKDSVQIWKDKGYEVLSFNFETNDDAMTYWEDQGFKVAEFVPFIRDELFNLNLYEGDQHPLIDYASMTDNKILIDDARMLNHKWIMASFTDGTYWGEVLLTYELIDRKELKFRTLAQTLYHN